MDTFASLLARTPDAAILDALEHIYREGWREDYAAMITELRETPPLQSTDYSIAITRGRGPGAPDEPAEVFATRTGDPVTRWSPALAPWGEWLSMAVDASALGPAPEADILAHLLSELSWGGWTGRDRAAKL